MGMPLALLIAGFVVMGKGISDPGGLPLFALSDFTYAPDNCPAQNCPHEVDCPTNECPIEYQYDNMCCPYDHSPTDSCLDGVEWQLWDNGEEIDFAQIDPFTSGYRALLRRCYTFIFRGKRVQFDESYEGASGTPRVRQVVLSCEKDGDETFCSGSLPAQHYYLGEQLGPYLGRVDYEIRFASDGQVIYFHSLNYQHVPEG